MIRHLRAVALVLIGMSMGHWMATHGQRPGHSANQPRQAVAEDHAGSPSGTLWLGDFESEEELVKRWKPHDVIATRSEEHATHGRSSAKVTFQDSEAPAFQMEDYLDNSPRRRNWRGYERLVFDLYNPQPSQERVILQLKDKDGRQYKEEIFVNGRSSQHISVRLEDLHEYLDRSHIVQFNLFRWKPKKVSTFYVDAIRLQPKHQASLPTNETASVSALAPVQPSSRWQAAWTSGLVKLFRNPALFEGSTSNPIQLALARGEYESVQLALIGGERTARVRVAVGPLTHASGNASFPPGVIEVRQVGYVKTKQPYYPVTYVGDWPDPLPRADEIEVPAGEVQPVWITVGAPENLPAGRYEGTITLTDTGGRTEQVALIVTVWDFTLPRTAHLKTSFDFYQFRLAKAYREFVPGGEVWEGRMDELEKLYFLDMLKHRVFPVMSANPTSARFGRDINLYLERGLGAFGVGSRGGSNGNNWPKDPLELERLMAWYREAAVSLRFQNLLDHAYIYTYDEPKPGHPHVAQVMAAIHRADPQLRNLLVMHEAPDPLQHAQWLKDADILCIRIAAFDPEQAMQFKQLGKEMWIYVSSPAHPFPALVIDYPAIAHRILPWMAWKYGATGLLYWCVNFWSGDPWIDPANYTKDQNGNGSLYYPTAEGPVPSIRLEVLRDGIEDYEYLYRLHELIQTAKARGGVDPLLLEQAERLVAVDPALVESLRSYAKDPEALLAQRRAIAEMIEKLQASSLPPR